MFSAIHRQFSAKVFVRGIPTNWDKNEMLLRFGTVGKLQEIYFVKNSIG